MKMIDILNRHNIDINSLSSKLPSQQNSKESLDYIEKSFTFLSKELTYIANSLVGTKIEKGHFKLKIQNFTNKIIIQINTIFLLYSINQVEDEENLKIDFQTIHIVIRSIIETVLMFSYIYIIPKSEDKQYFHHLVWEFTDLQNLVNDKSFSDENSNIKAIELVINERYEDLRNELESNKYFIQLNKKLKYKILKQSQCRYDKSWSDLASDFGLERTKFNRVYSDLCSYSHSGNNSIITDYLPSNLKLAILGDSLFYLLIIFSMFIIKYCMVTKKANDELSKNEKLLNYLSNIVQSASEKNIIIKEKFIQ